MISNFALPVFNLCLFFSSFTLMANNGEPAVLRYSFDACQSNTTDQSGMDYSEFIPLNGSNGQVRLTPVGPALRTKAHLNPHSCTAGQDGTAAICLSFDPFCNYLPGSSAAMRFLINLNPVGVDPVRLEELSFLQKAPETYNWVNGLTGLNNYPSLFAMRILKNGVVILDERELPTTRDWTEVLYDFKANPDFVVTTPTDFLIELTAYCPIGNIGNQSIWDLEDVTFTANCDGECSPFTDGGTLTLADGTTVYNGCLGNTIFEVFSSTTALPEDYYYIITDSDFIIREVLPATGLIDLSQYDAGIYNVYGYGDMGNGPMNSYLGLFLNDVPADMCASFSTNSLTIHISNPTGGTLVGGPFEFCVGDGNSDFLSSNHLTLTDNEGANNQWVLTGPDGDIIIGLPELLEDFDLDGIAPGTCLLRNLSYDGWLKGLEIGSRISELTGTPSANSLLPIPACFSLSNSIEIIKRSITPSMINGGPFTFCVGDGVADILTDADVSLTAGTGDHNMWVVTDQSGITIIKMENDLSDIDFENSPRGSCLLWSVSYNMTLNGLGVGADFTILPECAVRSNFITISHLENKGGIITTDLSLEFCVGDGDPDYIPAGSISLTDNLGANSQWLITDGNGIIINAPLNSYTDVNLNQHAAGTCYLLHMSYDGPLVGLGMGGSIHDITGCQMMSNSLPLIKNDCIVIEGGQLSGGPFSLCTGDGEPDLLSGIAISGNTGNNNVMILTDADGVIMSQVSNINSYDFDNTGAGTCLLWHLTFELGLTGADIGNNILTDLVGKSALSNSITINKNQPMAGTLEGGPFTFCVGDGQEDRIRTADLTHSGNNSQEGIWLITDENEITILGMASHINDIDFDNSDEGNCSLLYVAYDGPLMGLQTDQPLSGLVGCFSITNSVSIIKNRVAGGTLDNGTGFVQFCVGDGVADFIPAGSISLSGNIGDTETWVITNTAGNAIIAVPDSPYDFDFESTGRGTYVLWSLSSVGPVEGLEVGADFAVIQGCADRSNFITIFRYENTGGTISSPEIRFCVGDGLPDNIPSNSIILTGNTGANSQWLVVDDSGIIVNAPLNSYEEINFEQSPEEICQLYHLSYDGPITGLGAGRPLDELDGCFSLSNGIPIIKENCPTLIDDLILTHVSDSNMVQLQNNGDAPMELAQLWLCDYPEFTKVEAMMVDCDADMILEAGESIMINTGFDINAQGGEVALFYENEIGVRLIKGYVQWGEAGHPSENIAVESGLWMTGDFVPAFSEEMGISLIDNSVVGAMGWAETEKENCLATSTHSPAINTISIYPNPVKEELTINSELISGPIELILYNQRGEQVSTQTSTTGTLKIITRELAAGVYYLHLIHLEFSEVKKIVKI